MKKPIAEPKPSILIFAVIAAIAGYWFLLPTKAQPPAPNAASVSVLSAR